MNDEVESVPTWRATAVGATPLERTIDAIGMGRYQYAVLILSGLGWAADNMWLQGVAITLPRIQDEWGIRDQWIGLVSSSTFAGMMVGALAWGSYADTFGRKNAFNLTLLITAVFGLLSSFAPNFPLLCLCLFALGTGVGGSMPTDGTIFLEAVPKRNHYLLTALSVFFAAGSVVASMLGYVIIPKNSCGGTSTCLSQENKGWRYLLSSLGGLTMLFVVARLVFFTLFESPKYLVSAGKHEEAREVLQRIAAFNGEPKRVHLSDVSDRQTAEGSGLHTVRARNDYRPKSSVARGSTIIHSEAEEQHLLDSGEDEPLGGYEQGLGRRTTAETTWPKHMSWVPLQWRPSLEHSVSRYEELFSPYWRKTTILVWAIWTIFTLAFTMVNVFLPKYLESRRGQNAPRIGITADSATREEAMRSVLRDFLFYTLASLPGSLLGAFLIETPLGRIKSMAISTLLLAFSLLAFAMSDTPFFVTLTSCSISLFASVAYAVIYSYSPEVFKTSLRGTASGTASALSRLAGILAPVMAGALMQITSNLPLYLGFALFAVTVSLQLSLPYETRGRDAEEEEAEAACG
jgi:MFS family permease